jgi:hypothetical protein
MDDIGLWDEAQSPEDIASLAAGNNPIGGGTPGDFNGDEQLDAADIDALTAEVRAGTNTPTFDVNNDQLVNSADRDVWVRQLRRTYFGDTNLDGEFNSGDFVLVFQNGEYEDATALNSTWGEGDWNGDQDFTSSDFVTAFQDGGFELGPRPALASVPEPAAAYLLLSGACVLAAVRRRAVRRLRSDE